MIEMPEAEKRKMMQEGTEAFKRLVSEGFACPVIAAFEEILKREKEKMTREGLEKLAETLNVV